MTHQGGRPLKFKSVQELQDKIDSFFLACDEKEEPYTITGLALALDTTRDLLIDYGNKEEYSDTIKTAKLKCHNYAEKRLYGNNVAGVIFSLKNNYGWKDKTESDTKVTFEKPLLGGNSIEEVVDAISGDDSN